MIKNIYYSILILLLLPVNVWATCQGTSPNLEAVNASYDEVNDCVTASTYGDTITIPIGSSNWGTNTLGITKGVWLKGAGVGSTVITHSGDENIITFSPDATSRSNNTVFKVTGLELNGSAGVCSAIYISNDNTTAVSNIMIGDNKFVNIRNSVYLNGNIYGVAYNNQLVDVGIAGRGIGNDKESWDNHPFSYGGANNFYYEDNTISFTTDPATSSGYATSGGYYGWVEGGQGGRLVFRYNTYDFSNCTSGAIMIDLWDVHGDQNGGDAYATMGAEFYGNKMYNDAATGTHTRRYMYMRGAKLMMFNNNWAWSGAGTPYLQVTDEYCHHPTYPEYLNDTYLWLNLSNGTNIAASQVSNACENNQFWNYTTSFNGEAGVGCGTLANRPGTCTTGVGYWATDQSCSDLTDYVGASPTTPISGTLYKCTETNTWMAYYTPYTYPHPLRGETVATNYSISGGTISGGSIK